MVLSTAINEALAGTDTAETIGKSVPAPAAALSIDTVVLAAEPVVLAATMLLILKTKPEPDALDNRTLAVVFAGVKKVVVP